MLTFEEHNQNQTEHTEGGEGVEVDDGEGYSVGGPVLRRGEPELTGVREDNDGIPNAYPIYNYPEDPDSDPIDKISKLAKETVTSRNDDDEEGFKRPDAMDRLQYGMAPVESIGHGIYTYFSLAKESADKLHAWAVAKGIPHPVTPDHYHSTVVWSPTNLPTYKPCTYPIVIEPHTYRVTKLGTAMVLVYDHPIPQQQWQYAKELGAIFTYPKYVSHITLSYDPGDFDPIKIGIPFMEITLDREHVEALDPDKFKIEQMNTEFAKIIGET